MTLRKAELVAHEENGQNFLVTEFEHNGFRHRIEWNYRGLVPNSFQIAEAQEMANWFPLHYQAVHETPFAYHSKTRIGSGGLRHGHEDDDDHRG